MTQEKATIYRAENLDNLLVFRAHYRRFAFERHTHEEFALGLMEEGVQTFHCRGEDFYAPPGSLITVNPDEIHDGRSADNSDYRYRIIYIPYELMQRIGCEMVAPDRSHYFRLPVTVDKGLAGQLHQLFLMLENNVPDRMELQSRFFDLLSMILRKHGTEKMALPSARRSVPTSIAKACEYINEMAGADIGLDDIAAAADLSRFHFLHLFSATKGISPYAMLLNRRLQLAREAITKGVPIADAAMQAGFADQSHLSRRF